jgi:hypothetical protein
VVARAAGYKAALEKRRVLVRRKAACAAKVKKKLRVTLRGYAARAEELGKRLSTASVAIARRRWSTGALYDYGRRSRR